MNFIFLMFFCRDDQSAFYEDRYIESQRVTDNIQAFEVGCY